MHEASEVCLKCEKDWPQGLQENRIENENPLAVLKSWPTEVLMNFTLDPPPDFSMAACDSISNTWPLKPLMLVMWGELNIDFCIVPMKHSLFFWWNSFSLLLSIAKGCLSVNFLCLFLFLGAKEAEVNFQVNSILLPCHFSIAYLFLWLEASQPQPEWI